MTHFDFEDAFYRLTDCKPFPWQIELFNRFALGEFPSSCNIPTGLGKTAVVAVWLIALAHHSVKLPRRLVYVVNRRTVVDQTTNEVEKLRKNLKAAGLSQVLSEFCAIPLEKDEPPLAISTLRGQFADNREWSADPCRPAVIIGTVDMIGSRLLFSGYRLGFKGKPLHAGFLGQDTLIVHDEAHLEPAFQKLLVKIRDEQERCKEFRPFRVMALTATLRDPETVKQHTTFELTTAEKNPPRFIPDPPKKPIHHVWRRLKAKKGVRLHKTTDESKVAERIAEIALTHDGAGPAILVFVRKVEDVEKIISKLPKGQTQQLTSTLRGLERDQLPADTIFARFLPSANRPQGVTLRDGTVYLICTSAGEVGVNISADHLVCDLTTFESMAQRFGRVNRYGDGAARIDVVYSEKFDEKDVLSPAREKTLALLKQLPLLPEQTDATGVSHYDASPAALGQLDPNARQDAFAPEPTILPATDILFDSWALTTIRTRLPGRPPVEPFLHGIAEWEPPETHVAWREEVGVITDSLLERHTREDLLEDFPLKPHELLRDRSDRVFKHLAMIAERFPDAPIWLVDDNGNLEVFLLRQLVSKTNKNRINHCTVLLPPEVGGLQNGLLKGDSEKATDVADEWKDETDCKRRQRFYSDNPYPEFIPGMRLVREIDLKPDGEQQETSELKVERLTESDLTFQKGRWWRWYVRPRSADDALKTAQEPVPWGDHTEQVAKHAKDIAAKLALPSELQQAVELAAWFHDLGKKREVWQRSIGNPNPKDWYAKSGKNWKPVEITSYRHELGSLLDVRREPKLQELSHDMKELVLHLIATHHGRARPHFPSEEVFDLEYPESETERLPAQVARRFAALQRKYGRWGLAYLESLLRAADYGASAKPSPGDGV